MLTRRCCNARVLHKYTTVTCATCRNTAGLTWQAMFCVRDSASSVTFFEFYLGISKHLFYGKKSESNIFFFFGQTLYFHLLIAMIDQTWRKWKVKNMATEIAFLWLLFCLLKNKYIRPKEIQEVLVLALLHIFLGSVKWLIHLSFF